jgi:thiol-disulfide isomerase/thioredoxin
MTEDIVEIVPHLYLSNWSTSNNPIVLEKNNIGAIVTIETEPRSEYFKNMVSAMKINYVQYPLNDSPSENIYRIFDETYKFIDENIKAGKNVLVNCWAGVSRSSTIVLNYIIRKMYEQGQTISPNRTVMTALLSARSRRPVIAPNYGFMSQLSQKALEYSKRGSGENFDKKMNLNFNSSVVNNISDKMSGQQACDSFLETRGKPGNVICLTNEDFDEQGVLKNFKDVNGIIMFKGEWCGHCKRTKPEFAAFSNLIKGQPIRAFSVDSDQSKALIARIKPEVWGYAVRGYPTIVGYSNGKFYSEYGFDPANKQAFRTANDFLQYSKGLGSAEIVWQ